MREIKVRFEESDLRILDAQAKLAGQNRSELIRSRTLGRGDDGSGSPVRTPAEYNRLVSETHREALGSISRTQVEALVAFVFAKLAGPVR